MATDIYHFQCRCGAYAAKSWVDPQDADATCDICGQAMTVRAVTRTHATNIDDPVVLAGVTPFTEESLT